MFTIDNSDFNDSQCLKINMAIDLFLQLSGGPGHPMQIHPGTNLYDHVMDLANNCYTEDVSSEKLARRMIETQYAV